jgi:hypothetical protein
MNATEHAEQHAAASKRLTDSWHRHAADLTLAAQQRARDTEAKAKSDAPQQAANYHRDLPIGG